MEIKFEKGNMEDVDSIVSMQKELNKMLNLQDLDEVGFKKYIQTDIESEDKAYFVAKINGKTIGVLSVDFSDAISVNDVDYLASISLLFVDGKYRKGTIAYDLFKLGIDEMQNRGIQSFAMSVEDNNPNKYLHFAFADIIIEENEELTQNGTTTQYLLGVSDINKIIKSSFKEFMKKSVETKKNFAEVLKNMPRAQTIAYLF